jgi:hypothetical protein
MIAATYKLHAKYTANTFKYFTILLTPAAQFYNVLLACRAFFILHLFLDNCAALFFKQAK